jgi:hypothetical protein
MGNDFAQRVAVVAVSDRTIDGAQPGQALGQATRGGK